MAWFLRSRLSFETGRGELRKVPLTDRSLAAINTDSRIDVAMSPRRRDVHLIKGEAWFEVARNPDAPFVVSAGDIRVRAVGTAFSVRRRDDGADVLVTEGVVETWSVREPEKKTRLTAGDQAFVADAAKVATAYEPDEVTRRLAWRERKIILREETLSDAVAEFNRYNEQQIVIADPSLAGLKLVGGFDVDQPEAFARSVHAASDAPVSIRADRIIIGTQSGAG
jgi:transmembrane sensor